MHEPQGMYIGRVLRERCRKNRWRVSYDRARDLYCGADLTICSIDGRQMLPSIDLQITYLLHDVQKLRSFIYRFSKPRKPLRASARVFIGLEDNGRNTQNLVNVVIRELRRRYLARAPHRGQVDHLEVRADGSAVWNDPWQHLFSLKERRALGLNGSRHQGTVTTVNGSAFLVDEIIDGRPCKRLVYYISLDHRSSRPQLGQVVSFALMGKTNRGTLVGEYPRIEQ